MLVAAKGATGYSWRGLRYTWKGDGDAIEVPDELGSYLVTKRPEFWYAPAPEPEPEVEPPTVAPPPPAPVVDRAAPPSIGIAKGIDDDSATEG